MAVVRELPTVEDLASLLLGYKPESKSESESDHDVAYYEALAQKVLDVEVNDDTE